MKQIIEVSTSKEEIERLVPALHKGRTFYYEHLVRYFFASQYVKNKVVLDLGCGSGYGSLILAKNGLAKRVIGVDISKDALDYARKSNIYKGLEFRKDDIRNLKSVKTSTIDCVVNFEVIEHIKEQEELLSEIKRTLKPQGLLIISTPNKYISLGDNPFHEKELYPEEFRSLLNKYFKNVTLLYQQMGFKDVIKKLDGNTISVVEDFSVGSEKTYGFEIDEKNSQFIIAICSDSELPRAEAVSLDTLLTDGLDLTQGISSLSHQIEDAYKAYIELQRIYDSKTWKMLWLYKRTTHIPTNIIRKIVPIWVRKRIKSKFNTLFTPERATVISKFIQRDWKSWKNKREDESLDILIFGIISYDYRIQRPQHLAEEFSKKNNRVFYIENEFITHSNDKAIFAPFTINKITENIFSVKASASRELFIYKDIPSENDKKIIKASIKNLLREAEIINPVAKIDHPFWSEIIEELGIPVIYDCMDEHTGFGENAKRITELENKLFDVSDGVIVSSKLLEDKCKNNNVNNFLMLKNAGEFRHFVRAGKGEFKVPEDMVEIKKPVIGYYGAISEWFDVSILEKMVNDFPIVSIVLIGRVNNSKVQNLAKKCKNIHLLGEKPYSILPSYLQQFDVCIIPFVINDLIRATDPVKIYEYFATGKPVVTSKIPQLQEYKDVLYISKNIKEFSKNIAFALKENSFKLSKKRIEIAQKNTWEIRGELLEKWMNRILDPKVSIVVLSYNNPKVIERCLKSVLERSFYPNFEVIVVDNASNKQTLDVLDSFAKDERIKIIKNRKNLGFAAGNNIGLHQAKGDYLIILNNDTIVTPGWVSRLIYHSKKAGIGLVGPVTNNIGNEAKVDIVYDPNNQEDMEKGTSEYTYLHWGETLELKNIAAFCWIMRKDTYKKIGGLDERFGKGLFEDDDYCIRIRKKGLKILCAEDVFVHHWGGSATKWGTDKYRKLFDENKKKFEDKWKVKWTPHKYRGFK